MIDTETRKGAKDPCNCRDLDETGSGASVCTYCDAQKLSDHPHS